MAQTAQQITDDIHDHLQKNGRKNYSDYYIGITNDVERRLFSEHNASKEGHWYIFGKAINDEHARGVEKHYLDKGMKGGGGGGDHTAIYVYCYEIKAFTNE